MTSEMQKSQAELLYEAQQRKVRQFRTNVVISWTALLGFLIYLFNGPIKIDSAFIQKIILFIAGGLGQTFYISILSITLATCLALLAALGRLSTFPPFYALSTFYVSLIRGTPLYLQIFFFFLALPQLGIVLPGLFAGVLALGLVAAGWPFLRPQPVETHGRITTSVLFNREISQIFQKKCFQCHTENNVSMSLTTYKDARPWAVAIKEEILEKKMPPWSAVTGYGHFSNDVSLTAREVSLITSWADGGAPSGVLLADEDKPTPLQFHCDSFKSVTILRTIRFFPNKLKK